MPLQPPMLPDLRTILLQQQLNAPGGMREDGTAKGQGFLGDLVRPDGTGYMSEYSVADSEDLKNPDGSYMDYPSMVPTLTAEEIDQILGNKEGAPLSDSIIDKATAHAKQRLAAGRPVFADPGEQHPEYYPQFARKTR